MKKVLKVFCLLLALGLSFLAGWRVMPKIWPTIKTQVVYRLLPDLQPTPAPTREPYVPKSDAALGDEVLAGDSLIYYFYRDYCSYCSQMEPLAAGLPEKITLPDGTQSRVRLVCLDKSDEVAGQIIADYYAANELPEERQYVPAMVIGDRYMSPGNEIIDGLMDALMAGEGLNTPVLGGGERT